MGDHARGETSLSIQAYVNILCEEIAATPHRSQPLETVFFGGGTPSLLSAKQLTQILYILDQTIGISAQAECSIEMDPGTFNQLLLQDYLAAGITRISLGAQAFQNVLLQQCGRSHQVTDIYQSVGLFESLGFENYSLDLISGLPTQNIYQWEFSLERAIALSPQHLSCYDLVLEAPTVFGKRHEQGSLELPPDQTTAQMYRMASELLQGQGYRHYEISNYARLGFECRHNLTYWQNQPFYGFGMGAASYLAHRRLTRPKNRQDYFAWVANLKKNPEAILYQSPALDRGDQLFETLMVGLRLASGLSLTKLAEQFGEFIIAPICDGLRPQVHKGWVVIEGKKNNPQRIRLTDPEGFLYSNQVLVDLWDFLDRQGVTTPNLFASRA